MSCFVIAEAGVNHNGSLERALQMVDAAAAAGANAVKFQTFRADLLASSSAPKADYQTRTSGEGTQLAMLRALELSEDDHRTLFKRCQEQKIEFMSTPFDPASADFLVRLGMQRIKVPSGELTHRAFIEHLAAYGLPLLMSTGMADLAEVQEAIDWITQARAQAGLAPLQAQDLNVLHCTSNYPAQPSDVNLRALATLAQATGRAVGYSDHTLGITVSIAAVALGARVIEKHFTLDRTLPGPDHQASIEVNELAALVRAIRDVEVALGDGIKAPQAAELPVRDVARRSVTLRAAQPAGHQLSADDLDVLRPGTGIAPKALRDVTGRRLARALPAGTTLQWTDLA